MCTLNKWRTNLIFFLEIEWLSISDYCIQDIFVTRGSSITRLGIAKSEKFSVTRIQKICDSTASLKDGHVQNRHVCLALQALQWKRVETQKPGTISRTATSTANRSFLPHIACCDWWPVLERKCVFPWTRQNDITIRVVTIQTWTVSSQSRKRSKHRELCWVAI